jgi:hypothetical protein
MSLPVVPPGANPFKVYADTIEGTFYGSPTSGFRVRLGVLFGMTALCVLLSPSLSRSYRWADEQRARTQDYCSGGRELAFVGEGGETTWSRVTLLAVQDGRSTKRTADHHQVRLILPSLPLANEKRGKADSLVVPTAENSSSPSSRSSPLAS